MLKPVLRPPFALNSVRALAMLKLAGADAAGLRLLLFTTENGIVPLGHEKPGA